ncbi:MAG: ABC transporter permease [Dehalococcoidia bacterium]|nr:ABC transporter permease [Dehalococcoidia bacterium]
MRYLALFMAQLKIRYIYLKRYYFDTLSMIVTLFLVFLIIFLGASWLLGGTPGEVGDTLEGIVVGFMVWSFALMAYGTLSWGMIEEAQQGTLEQLYMSPLGFGWVTILRVAAHFVINVLIVVVILFLMMATTGRWLNLDILSLIPLVLLTVAGAYGIGFFMGGLALVFKRVQSALQILQFVLVIFIAAPFGWTPFMRFLPLSLGTRLIGAVMIDGRSLVELAPGDVLFLIGNSAVYFGLGFLAFKFFENVARDRGLLGHY